MAMFPQLSFSSSQEVRFKNDRYERYICVKHDQDNSYVLSTKVLKMGQDPEVDFVVHYYTAAENKETKMVLPVHCNSGIYLHMTLDKMIKIKEPEGSQVNEVPDNYAPAGINRADPRFFYFKASGLGENTFVLEAMNGIDYNHYLAVSDNGKDLTLMEHNSTDFPNEMIFSIDELVIQQLDE